MLSLKTIVENVRTAMQPEPARVRRPANYFEALVEGHRARVAEGRFGELFDRCVRESRGDPNRMTETATVLHESAHACTAVVLGVSLVDVCLCSDEDGRLCGGYAAHIPLTEDEGRAFLRQPPTFSPDDVTETRKALHGVSGGVLEAMTVTAAGPAMNALLGLNRNLARHDLVELEKWAAVLTGRPSFEPRRGYHRETRRLLAELDQQATHLLTLSAAWVGRVGSALLSKRRLTAAQVRRLQKHETLEDR